MKGREAIKKSVKGTSVDLSKLLVLQSDIKSIFRNLDLKTNRMKKAVARGHNKYYSKIMME